MNKPQTLSTRRQLAHAEKSLVIFILFSTPRIRCSREHPLFDCDLNLSVTTGGFYPAEAVRSGRSFPMSTLPLLAQQTSERPTVFTLLRLTAHPTSLQSLLDTTPPKRVPILWDGSAPAPSSIKNSAPLTGFSRFD